MIVDSKQASINREILSRFEQLQRCTQVWKIHCISQLFCSAVFSADVTCKFDSMLAILLGVVECWCLVGSGRNDWTVTAYIFSLSCRVAINRYQRIKRRLYFCLSLLVGFSVGMFVEKVIGEFSWHFWTCHSCLACRALCLEWCWLLTSSCMVESVSVVVCTLLRACQCSWVWFAFSWIE